jgi:hypothetical protein
MRIRINGKAVMCFCLMAVAAGAFLNAMTWPVQARLFPMIVSVPLFFLCAAELAFTALARPGEEEAAGLDFKISGDHDPRIARKRTLWIFLWCLGFCGMVLTVGFPIAVPLFVFLYLKPHCKEGWRLSITLSFVAWACFYGLFVKLLNVPFLDGWVQQVLKVLKVI